MSPKKNSTEKYRKRRKKERANREAKNERRVQIEAEFAQRIQSEPSLKEVRSLKGRLRRAALSQGRGKDKGNGL